MEDDSQTAYDQLKASLRINELALTEELIEQPQYQSDISLWTSAAQRNRDECKDLLDIAKAQAASDMRTSGGLKPPSEARIATEILLFPHVQGCMSEFRDAEFDLALWKGLADSARAKKDSMRTISDLIQAGYTSPTAMLEQRRQGIQKVRQATA